VFSVIGGVGTFLMLFLRFVPFFLVLDAHVSPSDHCSFW
jgi:hypothetical protein